MNAKARIAKLEAARKVGKANKYLCVINSLYDLWDTPEERAKGYKVQPFAKGFGGAGGDCLYFKTRAELDEFAARDDVDLDILEICYEEKQSPA